MQKSGSDLTDNARLDRDHERQMIDMVDAEGIKAILSAARCGQAAQRGAKDTELDSSAASEAHGTMASIARRPDTVRNIECQVL